MFSRCGILAFDNVRTWLAVLALLREKVNRTSHRILRDCQFDSTTPAAFISEFMEAILLVHRHV
eukprot:8850489-Lingulodinium_polyedra.AAC.1